MSDVPQVKLLRILRLIEALKYERLHLMDIAEICAVSQRTAYRYVHLLTSVGFIVDYDFDDGTYLITGFSNARKPILENA